MKIKRLVSAVVLVCILSGFAACKTLPSIPKGAEDCPIWDTQEGMIWAGIIDGMYPVLSAYNGSDITAASSQMAVCTRDKQDIQAMIAALRQLESHFVERVEPDSDEMNQLYMTALGTVWFELNKNRAL